MKKRKKRNYWTKEKCIKEALKYKSRSIFKRKSPGAFGNAYKNNWIDEICFHMKKVGNRFNRLVYVYIFNDNSVYVGLTHDIEERDNKHKRDKRSSVFKHIKKTGLMPELIYTEYMHIDKASKIEGETVERYKKDGFFILNIAKPGAVGGANLKWTFEKCKEEALKFKTRNEFSKKSNSAYNSARRYGWIDKICLHMEKNKKFAKGYWTFERCKTEALKYSSRNEFYKKSGGAYGASLRNKWLDKICSHMNYREKVPNGYWTKEKCKEESLRYTNKTEFNINSGAYRVALKNKWLNEICGHMKK